MTNIPKTKTIFEIRADFLYDFDKYIYENIGDDDIIDYWLTYGLPDGFSDKDLLMIAHNEDQWVEIVKAFAECCRRAGVI